MTHSLCRLYSDDAARTNGGYRSASLCVELRSKSATIGFLLPAKEVSNGQYGTSIFIIISFIWQWNLTLDSGILITMIYNVCVAGGLYYHYTLFSQILATAEETYPAFLYYMQEMLHHPIHYHSRSRFSSHKSSDFNGEDGYLDFWQQDLD